MMGKSGDGPKVRITPSEPSIAGPGGLLVFMEWRTLRNERSALRDWLYVGVRMGELRVSIGVEITYCF